MFCIIRKFIEEYLELQKSKDHGGKKAIEALFNMRVSGGKKDISSNLDSYIY
ncbi:MAG: hypothetical protein HQL15_09700 [Candidatus Omnitrophica bacterium]|nr:hypothetical protein [Candidatus Omnitrophota bacterium]